MTLNDMRMLERAYEDALHEMFVAATAIADCVAFGHNIPLNLLKRYRVAKLGVESTRRDLEYCLSLEISEIMNSDSTK